MDDSALSDLQVPVIMQAASLDKATSPPFCQNGVTSIPICCSDSRVRTKVILVNHQGNSSPASHLTRCRCLTKLLVSSVHVT